MTNKTEKTQPAVGQIWSYIHFDTTYKFEIVSKHEGAHGQSIGWNVIYLDSHSPYGENGWYTHQSFNDAKAKYIGWAPGYGPQPPAEDKCPCFKEAEKLRTENKRLHSFLNEMIALVK